MAQSLTVQNSAPTGVTARYIGSSGGTTTRYYWVQAIYASGKSLLSPAIALANTLAALDHNNVVYVEWNPLLAALGYNIFYTTTSTPPTSGAILVGTVTGPNFTDNGQSNSPITSQVVPDGFLVAHARYDFSVDGGAEPSTIVLALSDIIPAGAILLGGTINPTVALTSGGSATISIGTSAGTTGTAAIKALTAVATYSLDALLNVVPVFATPVKMTAAGTITITIAVAAVTAGVMDIFVFYVMPIAL
jgi:hypothetical protein